MRSPTRPTLVYALACLAVAVVAAFVNLRGLSLVNVLSDEPTYSLVGWRLTHWGTLPVPARTNPIGNFEHPPFAKVLLGLGQVVAGHQSIVASRVVAALSGLLTAAVGGVWIARVCSRWTGLAVAATIALVPLSVSPQDLRFTRSAMLDTVTMPLVLGAVALCWGWFRRKGRHAWLFAVLTGVVAGLATSGKENAFLGLVGPAVVGLAWSVRSGFPARLLQAVVAGAVALATFVATYLPFGAPVSRIRYLYEFQSEHSHEGHQIGIAGHITQTPPWWANLWFARQGLGETVTVLVVLGVVLATLLRRDRLTLWLASSLAVPFLFHSFLAGVVLPFYWVMWSPLALTLAVVGLARLWPPTTRFAPVRVLRAALVLAVVVAAALPVVGQVRLVAALRPTALSGLAAERAARGLHGTILTSGTYGAEIEPYVGRATVVTSVPARPASVDTVLLGQPRCRFTVSQQARAFVDVNVARGALRQVSSDTSDVVYVAVAPLVAPTADQVRTAPTTPAAALC